MEKKKIKIAHVITRLIKGGAQENVLLTARHLAERGLDVYLVSGFTSGPEGHISLDGIKDTVKFFTIPELTREINVVKDIIAFIKLYLFIKRNKFDIVHTHTSKAGILGRLAASLARTPVIIHTPHGHLFYGHFNILKTGFFIQLEKAMALLTDRIITLTEIGKREHIKFGISGEDKFTVISDGIELAKFLDYSADSREARREFGIPDDAPVVGIIARLVAVKGHRYLLDAFKMVLHAHPAARLLIVGDGVLKGRLVAYARDIGISANVIFAGLRYDIPRVISACDIITLSSLNEGLGIAILEAMAMKKPVVASDSGGIPEIVKDGEAGYLVPPKDPAAMAERIGALIDDPAASRSMGENGLKKINASFSIEAKIDELERLYNELLDGKFAVKDGRIKVLHIITRLIVGGAQENTLLTASGLDNTGYRVMLASGPTFGPEGDMRDSVKKRRVNFVEIKELVREIHPVKDIIAFFKIYMLIKRHRFDIVHTHTSKAGIIGRLAAKLAGCPVIIHTPHGHLFYGYYGRIRTVCFILLERAIARITNRIVTLTEIGKREHVDFGIAGPEKFSVIESGIEIGTFLDYDRTKSDVLRSRLGLGRDDKIVGTIARLVPIKGHRYLIEAAKDVVREVPRARFIIIGDGPLRVRLERLARRANLTGNLYFLGLRGDVPDLLKLFDVFVISSLNEGMGRVIVEAMASGLPVVATRVGGIPEVVNRDTGILVEPKDKDGLAGGIIALLKDEARARSMGENARERVKSIFSKDDMVRKIDRMYRELLAEASRI